MRGIQAYYTGPSFEGTAGHIYQEKQTEFKFDTTELIHFCLSALSYRKMVGPLTLYTDEVFFKFLQEKGLLHLWDKVDTSLAKEYYEIGIDDYLNWCGFKTFVLSKNSGQFIFLEHDVIIKSPIDKKLFECDFRFTHLEYEPNGTYLLTPDPELEEFVSMEDWEYTFEVCNLSIMYFNNDKLLELYTKKMIEFHKSNTNRDSERGRVRSIFDQQLMHMILKEQGIEYNTFSNFLYDHSSKRWKQIQDDFILEYFHFDHLWFNKWLVNQDQNKLQAKQRYYRGIVTSTFPKEQNVLDLIQIL